MGFKIRQLRWIRKLKFEPHGMGLSKRGRILNLKTTVSKAHSSSIAFNTYFTNCCSACEGHVKSVRREFSDQAWAALVAWKELDDNAVDAPLCNDCYFNFRDVLIERADEMKLMAANVAAKAASASSAHGAGKVARA
jgi:hypothetical protein